MQSYVLLALASCVLALPGIPASLAAFPPGQVSLVTRAAAAFGFGYAVSAGCAFLLAVVHGFRLSFFVPLWLAVCAALWAVALRRASLRDHAHALRQDIGENWLALLTGTLIIAVMLVLHVRFIHLLGASRYVYYLNGLQIANGGGVPAGTLEYGQSWPLATDKIVLDSLVGVLVLFNHNPAIGPGVLLWLSMLGAALGLWATAWELGLRRTGALLPLLVLNNQLLFAVPHISKRRGVQIQPVSTDFAEYRAEDFGRAVAFCALALGIYAIRRRKWGPAAAAGAVLAMATATHLVPAAVVALALCFAGAAELLRTEKDRPRLVTLRQFAVLAAVAGSVAAVIRLLAGGSFGLTGASNPGGYAALHLGFDPTAYLFAGKFEPLAPPGGGHWYVPPGKVVDDIMTGCGIHWPAWALGLLFAGCVLAAVLLFLLAPADLKIIGVTGAGLIAGLIGTALFFSWHYRVYVDGTFGVRRLPDFSTLGMMLLALGVTEALLLYLGRHRPLLPAALGAALVIVAGSLAVQASAAPQPLHRVSQERVGIVDWIRKHTPCDARFLVNQRTEGAFTSLTGRFALLEGMGPFLRVDKLPSVIHLFLGARQFFSSPQAHEEFLRRYHITYVVTVGQKELLGYSGPTGSTNTPAIRAAPFLRPVLTKKYATVFRVRGSDPAPVSPLLKGPDLHCITTRVRF